MSKTDRPSLRSPMTRMLERVLDSWMRQAMFTLPGRILSFDPTTQLATVEAGIERVVDEQGVAIPPIENVPVCFPGDGQYYFWHQITDGETEGLLHFNQRAIDSWIEQGGPVKPHENRILSEEDCFFEPGYRSKPDAIPGFKNDGAGISNYAGDQYFHLKSDGNAEAYTPGNATADVGGDLSAKVGGNATEDITGDSTATVGGTATVNAATQAKVISPTIILDGQVVITKSLSVQNNGGAAVSAEFTGDVKADTISLKEHIHSQAADSDGDTQSDTDLPSQGV